jgi:hypothetical protein
MVESLPPDQKDRLMPPEERQLLRVSADTVPGSHFGQNEVLDPSPIAPTDDELARLAGSPWHGFVELEFPDGPGVHAGVFTVVSAALGKRSHFSARIEQTLCVTMAVEDDSPACREHLDGIAAYLGEVLPNTVLKCVDIKRHERTRSRPPQRPVLSIVPDKIEGDQD